MLVFLWLFHATLMQRLPDLLHLQEAILSAEIALKCTLNQSVLERATDYLAAGAMQRANRVRTHPNMSVAVPVR